MAFNEDDLGPVVASEDDLGPIVNEDDLGPVVAEEPVAAPVAPPVAAPAAAPVAAAPVAAAPKGPGIGKAALDVGLNMGAAVGAQVLGSGLAQKLPIAARAVPGVGGLATQAILGGVAASKILPRMAAGAELNKTAEGLGDESINELKQRAADKIGEVTPEKAARIVINFRNRMAAEGTPVHESWTDEALLPKAYDALVDRYARGIMQGRIDTGEDIRFDAQQTAQEGLAAAAEAIANSLWSQVGGGGGAGMAGRVATAAATKNFLGTIATEGAEEAAKRTLAGRLTSSIAGNAASQGVARTAAGQAVQHGLSGAVAGAGFMGTMGAAERAAQAASEGKSAGDAWRAAAGSIAAAPLQPETWADMAEGAKFGAVLGGGVGALTGAASGVASQGARRTALATEEALLSRKNAIDRFTDNFQPTHLQERWGPEVERAQMEGGAPEQIASEIIANLYPDMIGKPEGIAAAAKIAGKIKPWMETQAALNGRTTSALPIGPVDPRAPMPGVVPPGAELSPQGGQPPMPNQYDMGPIGQRDPRGVQWNPYAEAQRMPVEPLQATSRAYEEPAGQLNAQHFSESEGPRTAFVPEEPVLTQPAGVVERPAQRLGEGLGPQLMRPTEPNPQAAPPVPPAPHVPGADDIPATPMPEKRALPSLEREPADLELHAAQGVVDDLRKGEPVGKKNPNRRLIDGAAVEVDKGPYGALVISHLSSVEQPAAGQPGPSTRALIRINEKADKAGIPIDVVLRKVDAKRGGKIPVEKQQKWYEVFGYSIVEKGDDWVRMRREPGGKVDTAPSPLVEKAKGATAKELGMAIAELEKSAKEAGPQKRAKLDADIAIWRAERERRKAAAKAKRPQKK